ncbi:hypothetical protein MTR67_048037 [Solanum verrucosum]|uniref:Tf2-1-like SH3-like domain-containing protein n=1 Tax=Solanum verrucosum TaxID=315347 RepID=A0AAF0UXQ6_SOLVR|nr:hypothetical protein MTR67_048037 [Solanum verrucosum]
MKGVMRVGEKGKLSPRYIGPYKVIRRIGQVAYELQLPQGLSTVHSVFHVSMLRKCDGDPSLITHTEDVLVTRDLTYEDVPLAILDQQALSQPLSRSVKGFTDRESLRGLALDLPLSGSSNLITGMYHERHHGPSSALLSRTQPQTIMKLTSVERQGDLCQLASLGVHLVESPDERVIVQNAAESSLVVEVKEKQ